jgi:hypothetical protein
MGIVFNISAMAIAKHPIKIPEKIPKSKVLYL